MWIYSTCAKVKERGGKLMLVEVGVGGYGTTVDEGEGVKNLEKNG